jgi:hypothetical protein
MARASGRGSAGVEADGSGSPGSGSPGSGSGRPGDKLGAQLAELERSGADPLRLSALRAAQRFKRSWVELAEVLVEVRREGGFRRWGHEDFHEYCAAELHLRRATVDKLTASYSTLQRLAPQVLSWDGLEREIPTVQAVDYFAKAMDKADASTPKPSRQNIKELRHAVFDEGQSVAELRRRFDPVFSPKPEEHARLVSLQRLDTAARRLIEQLATVEDLSETRVAAVEKALNGLRKELEESIEPLRERIEHGRRRTRDAS